MSDFDQIAAMPPGGQDPIPELQNLHQALSGMRDLQSRLVVQNQQNEQVLPPQSIQVNTAKGTVTMKDLPIATYEAFNRDRQQLNEIRGAFHQESERLKQQEQAARNQPPWVQLATALSANLASQKDMPGWVRGLGQTAAQLNPSADSIRAQRMQVLGEEAGLAEKAGGMDLALGREKRLTGAEDRAVEEEKRKKEEDKTRDIRAIRTELMTAAGRGEAPPPEAVSAVAAELHPTDPAKANAFVRMVNGTNEAALKKKTDDATRAADLQRQKDDASMKRELAKEAASLRLKEASAARMDAKETEKKQVADSKKEFTAYEKVAKPLQNLLTLETQTDKLEQKLDEAERENRAIGPVGGRIPGILVSRKTAELRSDMITMVAAINDAVIKGGARLWNPTEWKALSPKLVEATKTGAFNRGIIDSIREFKDSTRKAIVDSQVDVDWKRRKASLGQGAAQLVSDQGSTEDQVKKLLETVKPR